MKTKLEKTFKRKKVFLTGHTGFKGSWLSLWLKQLGAEVIGYSLPPPTTPNLFELLKLESGITNIEGDLRDLPKLQNALHSHQPDIVFHLAAQPIVLTGITSPIETFSTNIMGTIHLLEAARQTPSLKAMVLITTDKCYENQEWVWGYRENDRLGGDDPYSASKAMCELAAISYRSTYLSETLPIATARAGNVIGGGDFSDYRLIPDCVRALSKNLPIEVRNPESTRPWMHVLDPLYGYLLLGKKLLEEGKPFAQAWNFGPIEREGIPAVHLVEKSIACWGKGKWLNTHASENTKEKKTLMLNWDQAARDLGWSPRYSWEHAIEATIAWYRAYTDESQDLQALSLNEIANFFEQEPLHEIHTHTPRGCLSH